MELSYTRKGPSRRDDGRKDQGTASRVAGGTRERDLVKEKAPVKPQNSKTRKPEQTQTKGQETKIQAEVKRESQGTAHHLAAKHEGQNQAPAGTETNGGSRQWQCHPF